MPDESWTSARQAFADANDCHVVGRQIHFPTVDACDQFVERWERLYSEHGPMAAPTNAVGALWCHTCRKNGRLVRYPCKIRAALDGTGGDDA